MLQNMSWEAAVGPGLAGAEALQRQLWESASTMQGAASGEVQYILLLVFKT